MDDTSLEEKNDDTVLYLPGINSRTPLHKELRVFLEEEQKAYEAGLSLNEEREQEKIEEGGGKTVDNIGKGKPEESENDKVVAEDENVIKEKLRKLRIGEEGVTNSIQFPAHESAREEDEESRKKRGKGNVEKWLQILLEGTDQNSQIADTNACRTDEIIRKLNLKYAQKDIKILQFPESREAEGIKQDNEMNKKRSAQEKGGGRREETVEIEAPAKDDRERKEEIPDMEARKTLVKSPVFRLKYEKSKANEVDSLGKGVGSSSSFEGKGRGEKSGKEKGLARCESARVFRQPPSSPALILGMRKGVDCIRKKPLVISDDDSEEIFAANNFLKSSIKTIKKAVRI